jgi:PAS domain S-box-containing protein
MVGDSAVEDRPDSASLSILEELLKTALANSQVVLFMQDLDLRFTSLFNSHFGFTPEEVLGKTDADIFPPDDAATYTRLKRKVLETGETVRETVHVTRDGVSGHYDFVIQPWRDESGAVIGVGCAATDVTAKVRAMDELRFQAIVLESIHESVKVTDLDGRITYWNRGAEDIWGYRAEEMLGQPLAILYPEKDPGILAEDLSSIAQGHDQFDEWLGTHKNGDPVWVEIRTTALRDADGVCVGFVRVGKDITRRKQIEKERDLLLLREAELRRQLQQFLAMVAHEQRQGMTVILGHAQFLARRAAREEFEACRPSIAAIEGAATQMKRLVADLEDAASIGEGRFAIQPEPMDLAALVRAVVAERQMVTAQHQILVEAPGHLDGEWDPARLRQLVGNLVDNAIKYSPDGGEVIIRLGAQDSEVLLTVSDDGIGITAEQQEQLFDLFYRSGEVGDIAGLGLGLYLCQAIVQSHGGQIGVDSQVGQGSTFSVTLPITLSNVQRSGTSA